MYLLPLCVRLEVECLRAAVLRSACFESRPAWRAPPARRLIFLRFAPYEGNHAQFQYNTSLPDPLIMHFCIVQSVMGLHDQPCP